MKYETPELTVLSAINAIQNSIMAKRFQGGHEFLTPPGLNEPGVGYADWE